MDRAALGSRIKEARLAKKLTQTEVVGSFITRNMLSQIESGTATPSIKTLTYLAGVLELPVEQLIGTEEPGDLSQLQAVKQCLRDGLPEEAMDKASALPEALADERAALLAQASLRCGENLMHAGALPKAAELVQQAVEWSSVGIYANESTKARALLLMGQIAEGLADYYRKLSDK